jgi:hypothetical protein
MACLIYERLACSQGSQCSRLGAFQREQLSGVSSCLGRQDSRALEAPRSQPRPPYRHSALYSAMTTYISENFRFPTLNVLSRLSRTSSFS